MLRRDIVPHRFGETSAALTAHVSVASHDTSVCVFPDLHRLTQLGKALGYAAAIVGCLVAKPPRLKGLYHLRLWLLRIRCERTHSPTVHREPATSTPDNRLGKVDLTAKSVFNSPQKDATSKETFERV